MSLVHAFTVHTDLPFSLHRTSGWAVLVVLSFNFRSFAARGVAWSFFASLYALEAFVSLTSPFTVFPPRYVDILIYVYVLMLTAG